MGYVWIALKDDITEEGNGGIVELIVGSGFEEEGLIEIAED